MKDVSVVENVEKDTRITCSICGAVFEPNENTCKGCVVRKDCGLICCPNCGFGIPQESKLVAWFKEKREKLRRE